MHSLEQDGRELPAMLAVNARLSGQVAIPRVQLRHHCLVRIRSRAVDGRQQTHILTIRMITDTVP
jgi:hypothetical protein